MDISLSLIAFKKIAVINEVSFWNDSKSTNLASVVSACESFTQKVIWIGGGKNKGQDVGIYIHAFSLFGKGIFNRSDGWRNFAPLAQEGCRGRNLLKSQRSCFSGF